jgi:thiamine-monophosphate kinase
MIDISDGLACDLWHICEASGCGAELDEAALQDAIHPDAITLATQTGRTALDHALHDGEDFELIVGLRGEISASVLKPHRLIEIGRLISEPELYFVGSDGGRIVIDKRGWEHFRG